MILEKREELQTLLGVNIVVEAGAGTGKTTLLIDRLCLAVLAQGTPVEKLVALTFTEKAAAELKTRFIFKLQALVRAIKEGQKDASLKRLRDNFDVKDDTLLSRAETALARMDRASIGTIHGFCAEILKAYPLEAGLAPNAEIDSGQRAARLFDARWNSFLDEQLGPSAPRAAEWKKVLKEVSLPELKDFAQELCSGKIESYDYYAHRDMLAALCLERAARAEELLAPYIKPGKKLRKAEQVLQGAAASLRRTAAFLKSTPVAPAPESAMFSFPTGCYKDWEPEAFEEARSIVAFASKTTPEKQQLFLDAYRLVKDVTDDIRAEFGREGILSFDDLIVKTRNLLQNNLYVRRLLKEKFDVLFIDEFQDTDPVQGELLLFLAEEKASSAARWQDVRLAPGKLFVVGDPKQSIYRFRGADITAYELFTDLILKQGGVKHFLQQNFRSAPEIIETANSICSRAMIQQSAFQPAYVPIFTSKTDRGGASSWLFITAPEGEKISADAYRDNQAERIADWIEQNVGRLTLADGHKLAYRDIALLTRAATTVGPFTNALRRRGIAFNVETDKDFYRKQEVNDFLNFLRAAADPQDRTALAGVLRSPLGAMTDEEIYQLAVRGELNLFAKTSDEKAARCYALLKDFSARAGRRSLREVLEDVLDDTFLPEACAAAYEGEQTLANLRRLAAMGQGYAAEGETSLSQFLSEIQTLLEENPDLLTAPAPDDALDAVSVMTVHKSKGLEFPVVILADLSKKDTASTAKPQTHIFSWQYNMHGLRVGKVCDVNLAFLEGEQKKHDECEEVRVLYVALTRARERMLLSADSRAGADKASAPFLAAGLFPNGEEKPAILKDGDLEMPVWYAAYQNPDAFRYRHTAAGPAAETPREVSAWREAYARRKARYEEMLLHNQKRSPSELVQSPDTLTEAQRAGAELGTVCHRALERLIGRRETDVAQAVRAAAEAAGAPQRAAEAEQVLTQFAQSPLFAELAACKTLACEMPFSFLTEEGLVESGVMDAVLECPDGSIWVADYKTDNIRPGAEAATLDAKYRPQLSVYQQAARRLFPDQKVRCSAVFVRTFAAADL